MRHSTSMSQLINCPIRYMAVIADVWFCDPVQWMILSISCSKRPSDEHHRTSLTISQHWFRWWLDAIRQQAINWAKADQDIYPISLYMASLNHKLLMNYFEKMQNLSFGLAVHAQPVPDDRINGLFTTYLGSVNRKGFLWHQNWILSAL